MARKVWSCYYITQCLKYSSALGVIPVLINGRGKTSCSRIIVSDLGLHFNQIQNDC